MCVLLEEYISKVNEGRILENNTDHQHQQAKQEPWLEHPKIAK